MTLFWQFVTVSKRKCCSKSRLTRDGIFEGFCCYLFGTPFFSVFTFIWDFCKMFRPLRC